MMAVQVDYVTGMRQIVELLHDLGHRRFAFVGHHATLASLSVRQRAFTDAMERYGKRVSYQIATEADALDGGRRAAYALLDSGKRPTAIVCVNDFMATGVIRGLSDRGVRVPEDISVTGFDNVSLAEYTDPPLTTVEIPCEQIGRLAVQRLLQHDARGRTAAAARDTIMTPALIVRGSTAKARKDTR
jgi:DNA-binding LacI/PurR family transcriptional regulator